MSRETDVIREALKPFADEVAWLTKQPRSRARRFSQAEKEVYFLALLAISKIESRLSILKKAGDFIAGCASAAESDLFEKTAEAIALEADNHNQHLRDALMKASEALSQFSRMEAAFADNVMGELILRVPPSCSLTKRHLMQASEAKALCDAALPVTPKPNNKPDRPGDRS